MFSENKNRCFPCLEVKTESLYPLKLLDVYMNIVLPNFLQKLEHFANPLVCHKCSESLSASYHFISRCLSNKQKLLSKDLIKNGSEEDAITIKDDASEPDLLEDLSNKQNLFSKDWNKNTSEEDAITIEDDASDCDLLEDLVTVTKVEYEKIDEVEPEPKDMKNEEIKSDDTYSDPQDDNYTPKQKKPRTEKPFTKLSLKLPDGQYQCHLCKRTFNQRLHVDGHLISKHKDVPNIRDYVSSKIHDCQYCSYMTINSFRMKYHLLAKHEIGKDDVKTCK